MRDVLFPEVQVNRQCCGMVGVNLDAVAQRPLDVRDEEKHEVWALQPAPAAGLRSSGETRPEARQATQHDTGAHSGCLPAREVSVSNRREASACHSILKRNESERDETSCVRSAHFSEFRSGEVSEVVEIEEFDTDSAADDEGEEGIKDADDTDAVDVMTEKHLSGSIVAHGLLDCNEFEQAQIVQAGFIWRFLPKFEATTGNLRQLGCWRRRDASVRKTALSKVAIVFTSEKGNGALKLSAMLQAGPKAKPAKVEEMPEMDLVDVDEDMVKKTAEDLYIYDLEFGEQDKVKKEEQYEADVPTRIWPISITWIDDCNDSHLAVIGLETEQKRKAWTKSLRKPSGDQHGATSSEKHHHKHHKHR